MDVDGLNMQEVAGHYTHQPLSAAYFRGSKPIVGVWAMSGVEIANACVMPVGYGVGDHRLCVVDIVATPMVGMATPKIIRPPLHRLNTRISSSADKYNAHLE